WPGEATAAGSEAVPAGMPVRIELLTGRVDNPAEGNSGRIDRAMRVAGKGRTRLSLRREGPPRTFGVRGLNTETDQLVLPLARDRRRVAALGILVHRRCRLRLFKAGTSQTVQQIHRTHSVRVAHVRL